MEVEILQAVCNNRPAELGGPENGWRSSRKRRPLINNWIKIINSRRIYSLIVEEKKWFFFGEMNSTDLGGSSEYLRDES